MKVGPSLGLADDCSDRTDVEGRSFIGLRVFFHFVSSYALGPQPSTPYDRKRSSTTVSRWPLEQQASTLNPRADFGAKENGTKTPCSRGYGVAVRVAGLEFTV